MSVLTTLEQVKTFVIKFTGAKPANINLDTTLENDLGITGDDGVYFMEAFFSEFRVGHTGYELTKYFDPEGFDPIRLSFLLRKLLRQPPLTFPTYDLI